MCSRWYNMIYDFVLFQLCFDERWVAWRANCFHKKELQVQKTVNSFRATTTQYFHCQIIYWWTFWLIHQNVHCQSSKGGLKMSFFCPTNCPKWPNNQTMLWSLLSLIQTSTSSLSRLAHFPHIIYPTNIVDTHIFIPVIPVKLLIDSKHKMLTEMVKH